MRGVLLCLVLTSCMSGGDASKGGAAVADCLLSKSAGAGLFTATVEASAPDSVKAALAAGEVVASAEKQKETFDNQIREIAKSPAASASWASVAPDSSKARSVGLAADLPGAAEALRKAGTTEADVAAAIDGASKARLSNTDLADAFLLAAKAAETYGPVTGFGVWFTERVEAGDRGQALADDIDTHHQTDGAQVGADKAEICHRPPGNPDNAKTLSVGASAVSAHLAHGDTEGPCPAGAGDDKDHGGDKGVAKPDGKGGGKGKNVGKGGGKGHGKH